MIFRKGNVVDALLDNKVDLLLHVANCQGKMNSGVAKEIRARIPEAYNSYLQYKEFYGLALGTISRTNYHNEKVTPIVVNAHAQEYYGYDGHRYLNYGALSSSLKEVVTLCKSFEVQRVGIPYKMGCDRAGGDWAIVKELLHFGLTNYGIDVVSYELPEKTSL